MPTKIRILVLTWEYADVLVGGLALLAESVVEELKSQGAEVDIAMPYVPVGLSEKLPNIINLHNRVRYFLKKDLIIKGLQFDLDQFSSPRKKSTIIPPLFQRGINTTNWATKVYPKNTPKVTRAFAHAVQEFLLKNTYDIIIGMDWETIPTQVLLQNNPTPFLFYINATEADRNPKRYDHQGDSSYAIYQLEKKYFGAADKVITISHVTSHILQEIYNVPSNKIHIVHNDITFNPELMGFRQITKGKNVLYIGRITAQKGLDFLIETAARVVTIDNQVKFFICGDGESVPQIVQQIATYKLEKNVFLTGWANNQLKKQLYRSSDIFVMPSPREPFGLTALEAVRSGVPVIASEQCGFVEIIPSTPTFVYHDIESFAQMILYYTSKNNDRSGLLRTQQHELSLHSWPTQINGLIEVMHELTHPK